MNLLIKNVQINDPASAHHGKVLDVLIQDGKYHSIGKSLKDGKGDDVVDGTDCVLSPGWFDMRVSFKEPGDEQKETIRTGQDAAAAGGFTGVLLMPSTNPPLQTNADISFVKRQAANHLVDVIPAGVLTEKREGKELSGMYDMQLAGARAFTDDKRSINNSGVMLRAMQYAANIGTSVIAYTDDPGLTNKLQANESPATTVLGFKGMPSIAEEISVQRNLSLVAYSGHPVHLSGISTKEAVEIIREAKKKKLPVTAEVYVYHLALEDGALATFDSLYKVKPPLRSSEDLKALQKAVIDGTIDVVCSDHCPEDIESKDVEFDFAAFGMIGLESFYGVLNTALKGKLSDDRIYELLVKSPRQILKLDIPSIHEKQNANFTLYRPKQEWVFDKSSVKSLSMNSPFIGKKLTGKVVMVGNNNSFQR
jgi:dihydroorotase